MIKILPVSNYGGIGPLGKAVLWIAQMLKQLVTSDGHKLYAFENEGYQDLLQIIMDTTNELFARQSVEFTTNDLAVVISGKGRILRMLPV